MPRLIAIAAVTLFGSISPAYGDLPDDDMLYHTILEMDAVLFNAFHDHDIETTAALFDPDLEFFHDTAGLSDYQASVENSRRLFEEQQDLTRELLPESVSVYPVPGYGAIQVGQHRFCHPENDVMDCGVFEFMHIWKLTGNSWTLTRVVSYAH